MQDDRMITDKLVLTDRQSDKHTNRTNGQSKSMVLRLSPNPSGTKDSFRLSSCRPYRATSSGTKVRTIVTKVKVAT